MAVAAELACLSAIAQFCPNVLIFLVLILQGRHGPGQIS
jgi:hypothetical protein